MADPNKTVGENWLEAMREKDEAYQNEREQASGRAEADHAQEDGGSQVKGQATQQERPDKDAELGIGCSRSATSTPPPSADSHSGRSRPGQQRRESSPPSHPNSNTCGRSTHLHTFARPRPSLATSTPSSDDNDGSARGQSGHATSFVGAAGGGSTAHAGQGTGDNTRLSRAPSAFGDTGQEAEGGEDDGARGGNGAGEGERKQNGMEAGEKGYPDQRSLSQSSDRSVGVKGGQEDEVWRKCELIDAWALGCQF
jgi:hypothetical protein